MAGSYNIGGASDGVARALKEAGLQHRMVFIGHGLTPDRRGLPIDGTLDAVITQSPMEAMMSCVRIFCNLRDKRHAMNGVEFARSQVLFRKNLPWARSFVKSGKTRRPCILGEEVEVGCAGGRIHAGGACELGGRRRQGFEGSSHAHAIRGRHDSRL